MLPTAADTLVLKDVYLGMTWGPLFSKGLYFEDMEVETLGRVGCSSMVYPEFQEVLNQINCATKPHGRTRLWEKASFQWS